MNILYPTKIYSLEWKSFLWINFLFLFLISCSNTKFEVDKEFEIDKKYELFLITNLDKINLESQIYFIQNEHTTCEKRMIELQNDTERLLSFLAQLDERGIYDEGIWKKYRESKNELQAEKRKLNTIIKVAKKYGIRELGYVYSEPQKLDSWLK